MAKSDSHNPYVLSAANDKGAELTNVVMGWLRSNRNSLNATQKTNAITAITALINETVRY
jgi:hypothetical protein